MKKKTVILLVLFLLVLTGYALYNFPGMDIIFANLTTNKNSPKKYDQFHDLALGKKINFGSHELNLTFESVEPIQHFFNDDKKLIIITQRYPKSNLSQEEKTSYGYMKRDFTYFKLDKNGEITDRFTDKNGEATFYFGNYIVNLDNDHYNTWIVDGDSTRKSFITQNKDLNWTAEKQNNTFKKIISKSKNYYISGANDFIYDGNDLPLQQITYLEDGKWYKLFTNTILKGREKVADKMGHETGFRTVFQEYKPIKNHISPIYFQRKLLDVKMHNAGGNTQSFGYDQWSGDLFCELFAGKDTLKFKIPFAIEDDRSNHELFLAKGATISHFENQLESKYNPYYFYENVEIINFNLFKTQDNKLYLIKKIR